MNWITREKPQIDRIACPWLIKRFIDQEAQIFYVPAKDVLAKAKKLKAIPFDIAGVEYTHYKDECTFDFFLKKHKLKDPALQTIARIVRAADTDRHDLAAQAPGLWAIFAGLAFNIKNDAELLRFGEVIYDGLYSWAKHLQKTRHTQNPYEVMLVDIHRKYLKQKRSTTRVPGWVKELKELIQDQVDTNLTLTLTDASKTVQKHPAYLSKKFSKYFDNLTFGEYIRKLRIKKAIELLETSEYSLAEIALLTGFSDQSHFTRVFKNQAGMPPQKYRKSKIKRK